MPIVCGCVHVCHTDFSKVKLCGFFCLCNFSLVSYVLCIFVGLSEIGPYQKSNITSSYFE